MEYPHKICNLVSKPIPHFMAPATEHCLLDTVIASQEDLVREQQAYCMQVTDCATDFISLSVALKKHEEA